MTGIQPTEPPTIAVRPEAAVVASILLIYVSDWLFMLESLFRAGGIDLGFTDDNVIYLIVRNGFVATAVLVAGAVGLGRRWLLVTASIVAGVHTLFVLGMAVVQLALGERTDFLVETVLLILCLFAILAAVTLGFLAAARDSRGLRWAGLLLAAGAVVVWTIVTFIRPFSSLGLSFPLVAIVLLDVVLVLLLVVAAGLVGMRSAPLRYTAFALCVLDALWQLSRLPQALPAGFIDPAPTFLVLRTLAIIAAAVFAFLAARSWQRGNVPGQQLAG